MKKNGAYIKVEGKETIIARSQIANTLVNAPLLSEYATRRFIALFVLKWRTISVLCGQKTIEKALLLEASFVSQQMIYHGTGNENITGHFEHKGAGGVGDASLGIFEELDLESLLHISNPKAQLAKRADSDHHWEHQRFFGDDVDPVGIEELHQGAQKTSNKDLNEETPRRLY